MSIFVLNVLAAAFIYIWYNSKTIGYHTSFYIVLTSLLISNYLIFYDLFNYWLFRTEYEYTLFLWSEIGNNLNVPFSLNISFYSLMLSFVMINGSLFVFWFTYIDLWDDKEGLDFIVILGFFVCFMLVLIFSNNLIVFYLGWEGIGITSLLLIAFWGERLKATKASFKVFAINRIGDFFMLVSFITIILSLNDSNFDTLNYNTWMVVLGWDRLGYTKFDLIEFLGVVIVLSGCVKSAQFGFHLWLLEAMEAPLGASSLMHSSTLVMAGLSYIYKLHNYVLISSNAVYIMIWFGIWSAFISSFVACFQYELKTILAYSTISNMGYMFIVLGLNGLYEFVIILVFHAYLKIFLFLVIGAIIMYCDGCQDIRHMGGLFIYIPGLFLFYFIASLCLTGLPYWSGYYYKAGILRVHYTNNPGYWYTESYIFTSFLFTFVYTTRIGYFVFFGAKNGQKKIYKNKKTHLSIFTSYLVLIFIILHTSTFWNIYANLLLHDRYNLLSTRFLIICYPIIFSPVAHTGTYYFYWLIYMIILSYFFVYRILLNAYDPGYNKAWWNWFIFINLLFICYIL